MNGPAAWVQVACACYLCGVIWVIQLIHYPSFALIEPSAFPKFHRWHSSVMTAVVGPAMLIELGSALYLARNFGSGWVINLVSVLIPFVTTFAVSVPLHERLGLKRESAVVDRLVRTNWIRTVAWTGRAIGLLIVASGWSGI